MRRLEAGKRARITLLRKRSKLFSLIRHELSALGFLEYDPPLLVRSPGLEPHLSPFRLAASEGEKRRYLHTSPEYALKRLLGFDKELDRVFALTPCFRDEPPSKTHSPEFTMLEWYRRGEGLEALMSDCERLLRASALALNDTFRLDRSYDLPEGRVCASLALDEPFERLTVDEAFSRYAEINLRAATTPRALLDQGRSQGLPLTIRDEELEEKNPRRLEALWDVIFHQIFLSAVEPQLGRHRPTFLTHYPASQAALARLDPSDPDRALRFELFAGGLELANAFDELADETQLRARFLQDLADRRAEGSVTPPIDELLLQLLPEMGPCAGIALGFDRLLMCLTGEEEIHQLRLQPWEGP